MHVNLHRVEIVASILLNKTQSDHFWFADIFIDGCWNFHFHYWLATIKPVLEWLVEIKSVLDWLVEIKSVFEWVVEIKLVIEMTSRNQVSLEMTSRDTFTVLYWILLFLQYSKTYFIFERKFYLDIYKTWMRQ